MVISQRARGPRIEQSSDWFEFTFENLTDANGEALDFTGWEAEMKVTSLYNDNVLFTLTAEDITISSDDISASFNTSAFTLYVPGEYRYYMNLTEAGGKIYNRIIGVVIKQKTV